jgi:hypothetical protein
MLAMGVALLVPGIWLRTAHLRAQQSDNDAAAARIMAGLRADPQAAVGKFYLYLRAFESTGTLRVPLYLRLRKLSLGLFQPLTSDTESYVSNALRGIAPLIAMGLPGEAVGAGRVHAEESGWTGDVLLLMRRAQAILLVPSSRPGTMWEMQTLKDHGLLAKVIFIMPPAARGESDTQARWAAARQALGSLGIESPEHQTRGLMFEVGPDLKVSNVEPLLLNSVRQVRKSMERIMSDDPPRGGLFQAMAVADRRLRRAAFWGWGETLRQLSPYPLVFAALLWPPASGSYDPQESWSMTLDRNSSIKAQSEFELTGFVTLQASARYRAIEAATPADQLDGMQQTLLQSGLPRLPAPDLIDFYGAVGRMLQRVSQPTCAAVARGTADAATMAGARSYMPATDVRRFLAVRAQAIVAAAEEAPILPVDPALTASVGDRFTALLGADDAARFERVVTAAADSSDAEVCWQLRTTFAVLARMPPAEAGAFAQVIARGAAAPDDGSERMHAQR